MKVMKEFLEICSQVPASVVSAKRLNWPATVSRFPQSFHQPSLSATTVNGSWGRSVPRDPIGWTWRRTTVAELPRCDAIPDTLRPLARFFVFLRLGRLAREKSQQWKIEKSQQKIVPTPEIPFLRRANAYPPRLSVLPA